MVKDESIFEELDTVIIEACTNAGLSSQWTQGFFTPFKENPSLFQAVQLSAWGDFRSNLKGVVIAPLIASAFMLGHLAAFVANVISGFFMLTLSGGPLAFWFDAEEAESALNVLGQSVDNLLSTGYCGLSALVLCLGSLTKLITHSLTTVTLEAGHAVGLCDEVDYDEYHRPVTLD